VIACLLTGTKIKKCEKMDGCPQTGIRKKKSLIRCKDKESDVMGKAPISA
jgi:hypothetical protein